MRTSTLSRDAWIHSCSLPLFIIASLTGVWSVLAIEIYDKPLLSPWFFTVSFLHIAISCWYVWFVPHRSRWPVLALAVIVIFIFAGLCFLDYGPNAYLGPIDA